MYSLHQSHHTNLEPSYQKLTLSRAFNLAEFIKGKAQQPLPPAFAPREEQLDQFHKYCHSLMEKILALFAIGIEVPYLIPFAYHVLTDIFSG